MNNRDLADDLVRMLTQAKAAKAEFEHLRKVLIAVIRAQPDHQLAVSISDYDNVGDDDHYVVLIDPDTHTFSFKERI